MDSLRIANLGVGFSLISSHVTQAPNPAARQARINLEQLPLFKVRDTIGTLGSPLYCGAAWRHKCWLPGLLGSGTWGDWRLRSRRRGWMPVQAINWLPVPELGGFGTSCCSSRAKVMGISNNIEIGHRLRVYMPSSQYIEFPSCFPVRCPTPFGCEKMVEIERYSAICNSHYRTVKAEVKEGGGTCPSSPSLSPKFDRTRGGS